MINIEKFRPKLKEDIALLVLATQINELEEQFNQKVILIKKTCEHGKISKTWEYPHKVFVSEKGALLEKECLECGLVRKKPAGMPWVVCQKCWGKMTDDGHGMMGKDRAHFYKCKNCGHTEHHT